MEFFLYVWWKINPLAALRFAVRYWGHTQEFFTNSPQYKTANISNFVLGLLIKINQFMEVCGLEIQSLCTPWFLIYLIVTSISWCKYRKLHIYGNTKLAMMPALCVCEKLEGMTQCIFVCVMENNLCCPILRAENDNAWCQRIWVLNVFRACYRESQRKRCKAICDFSLIKITEISSHTRRIIPKWVVTPIYRLWRKSDADTPNQSLTLSVKPSRVLCCGSLSHWFEPHLCLWVWLQVHQGEKFLLFGGSPTFSYFGAKIPTSSYFLGGLSLHLNHLIASRVGICYRQFGTLPIGIFLSNLDSRQLDTSLMTSYGHFCHMSTFGDSRAIWVLLPKYGALRKLKFSWWRSDWWSMRPGGFRWADNWATWWYHFFWGCNTLKGWRGPSQKKGIFQDICDGLKGTWNWPIWPRISP